MKKANSRSAQRNSVRRQWNHVARLEQLEGREMLNATNELLSLRLAATDLHGNAITQITQGESFLIKAYIDDRRGEPGVVVEEEGGGLFVVDSDPFGFYTAAFNITFDSAGFEFDPTYGVNGIKFGPNINAIDTIPNAPQTEFDGYVGMISVQNQTQGFTGEIEALSMRMIAQAPGVYDVEEGFNPHFHFDVIDRQYDPNAPNGEGAPIYTNGVPQLERLTGQDFNNATIGQDEYFSLHRLGQYILTDDEDVYFEGVDLEVIAASTPADYQLRYVTNPTLTSGGEVNTLPSNVDTIDEWNYFYVEVYAKAPAGSSVQAGVVELSYNPDDFSFVKAFGRVEDPSSLRYSVTLTDVDAENGTVRIGYSSLSTDLGDDRYALIGRIQLRSEMELTVDYTDGELTYTESSDISLTESNATVYDQTTFESSVIVGSTTPGYHFEVWPVIYDVANAGEDRRVGLSDFGSFVEQFGKFVNGNPLIRKFDFNNSGKVDLADYGLFVQNFGQSASAQSSRVYPAGYPGDLGGVPLMGNSFLLEGEPVDTRSTQPTSTTATTPEVAPKQFDSGPLSSESFSTTLPLMASASSYVSTNDTSDETPANDPEESTDAAIASFDEQADLIVLTASQSEETEEDSTEGPTFADHADEVLALWKEDEQL